ncbi:BED zinc finger [Striga asiatica]|uniref:BED zinc finger n=1 Tax=Striga asiatica TaxID=4170 RepID=A0A5A7QDN3_STRAF|nr:BED zinc finger [Striga asiatica]
MVDHGERPTSSQNVDMPPENSPPLPSPISVNDCMHTPQDEMSPPVNPRTLDCDENEMAAGNDELYGNLKAEIWKQYERPVMVNGTLKAKCKHCKQYMLGNPSQGTSHLRKHFERCKSRKSQDIRQMVLKGNFSKEKFELSPYSFDQELSRKELAKMIIKHEYPLKMVEHEGFKNFAKSLNPCFKMVTRNTVKSDCFKIYEKLKESVMHIFEVNEKERIHGGHCTLC